MGVVSEPVGVRVPGSAPAISRGYDESRSPVSWE